MQNKKPFKMILHVGRVTSLQSWVAKKSCHGQTVINECFVSDYPFVLYLSMKTVQVHLLIGTTLGVTALLFVFSLQKVSPTVQFIQISCKLNRA